MPRKKRINRLYTLDTETVGLGGDIKRIALYDGKEIFYGYTFEDVEPILERRWLEGEMPHLAIHNLEFDIRKLNILKPGKVNWNTSILINNKFARVDCMKYILHDSFKLLPMSLAKLSKDFDLEHGKLDLWDEVQKEYPGEYENHVDFLNRCDPDNPLYVKYLGYDVISLYELMEKLMNVTGLTLDEMVNRVSTASLSKYILKNGYKGKPFQSPGQRKTDYQILTQYKAWSSNKPCKFDSSITYRELEDKIREGYYGGRTEVFTPRVIGGKAYHFDINSMYPSCYELEYPVGQPEYKKTVREVRSRWNMWLNDGAGLGYIKVTVYIPAQHIPPLPVKMGKLVFPTGLITGTWTFHELQYAVEKCGVEIREYHEVIWFPKTYPVLRNFLHTFYPMKVEGKKTGNAALAAMAKLLLNTGYGYLCLNRNSKTELKNIEEKEKYLDRFNFENKALGYINIDSIVISESIQVAAGAYVTSYARLILLDALRKMDERGTVYYCDTDSIVCSEPLPPEMVHPTDLGMWACEATISDGIFLFPKVYCEITDEEGENVKFKGVSRETQKTLDFEYYENMLAMLQRGEKDEVLVERGKEMLRSVSYAMKTGQDPNRLEYRDKKINIGNVQKRNVDYKENYSMPWHFETVEEFKAFTFNTPIKKWEEHGNLFDPMMKNPKKKKVKE